MVLEISLRNFFSIKDEVILDMRAANLKSEKTRVLHRNSFEYDDIDVLKTVALYGANASGKSNIIKAIRFCNAMVFESHNHNENTIYNFLPFKFEGYTEKPSTYSISFVIDNIEYEYGFTLTRRQILKESLYYYPNGKRAKVFERDETNGKIKKDIYSFGASVIRRPMDVAENTSNKTLYISRASQMDRDIPKKVFKFFHETFILNMVSYSAKYAEDLIRTNKDRILRGLRIADSDIVDFNHTYRKGAGKNAHVNLQTSEVTIQDIEMDNIEIKLFHKPSKKVSFDLKEESDGTQVLFQMLILIIDIIRNNKILLVDEIERSLHPKIIEYIVELFHASDHAQLIFSTHNTHLLDLNKMRKDQIWFVNKTEDGATDLYSLYDYSDFRDTMDVEKAYLQGRFDAVPIIDDSESSLESIVNN
jgi:AAA15 family ATPase/GTPase